MRSPATKGECAPRFEAVRRLFEESFQREEELGASLCVWHQGEQVVDLWGGYLDRECTQPWQRDTLTTAFSTTKGMVALCFLMLAERGVFDYDQPVAEHWPEFAQEGKGEVAIRTLLNHRAGLFYLDTPFTLADLEDRPTYVAELAARQKPHWVPGTAQGYHGVTYGIYTAELFRRIAGESLGTFLGREIRDALSVDFFLGMPTADAARISPVHPLDKKTVTRHVLPALLLDRGTNGRLYRQVAIRGAPYHAFAHPAELGGKALRNFNDPRVRALELLWANGITNARALARIYALVAGACEGEGKPIIGRAALEALAQPQSWSEFDLVLRKPQGFCQGFGKEAPNMFAPDIESFGHPGAGGALGWCDPARKLAIGYVPNLLSAHVRSPRARALSATVYGCLA